MFICEPLGIVAHIRVASVFRHLSLDIYIYMQTVQDAEVFPFV